MGLLPQPRGRIARGSIRLDGEEWVGQPPERWRALRGRRVAMVFQDPMTSLNPYMRIGDQLAEVLRLRGVNRRREVARRAAAQLERVGIPDARGCLRSYPHRLSGGMRQRVMIAMALLAEADLLIADEATTALDVTIQAQILALLRELRDERAMSMLLITHDLGVVSGLCDRVVVMYAGRALESGPARVLFDRPAHPYTRALLRATPRVDGPTGASLESLDGLPPRLDGPPPPGCRFAARCSFVREACRSAEPELEAAGRGRLRRCIAPLEELEASAGDGAHGASA